MSILVLGCYVSKNLGPKQQTLNLNDAGALLTLSSLVFFTLCLQNLPNPADQSSTTYWKGKRLNQLEKKVDSRLYQLRSNRSAKADLLVGARSVVFLKPDQDEGYRLRLHNYDEHVHIPVYLCSLPEMGRLACWLGNLSFMHMAPWLA
eukprot:1161603-Pelagomonas_calceolata.AAC.20